MEKIFSELELGMLIRLLIAHLLTDFYWQPAKWVQHKNQFKWGSPYLYLHGLLTAAVAWLAVPNINNWKIALIIFITHTLIDGFKISLTAGNENKAGNPVRKAVKASNLFVADQLLHIAIIITLWVIMVDGGERMQAVVTHFARNTTFLLLLCGYLLIAQPAGFLIQHMTRRWWMELDMKDSLRDAGKWIGVIERLLVLTFVLINQFSAIGFLVAAKSILRLIDKPIASAFSQEAAPFSSRKMTEYVLIGTFLSFGIAVAAGLFIKYLLQL